MEVSDNLLVSLMFVTILSMAIGGAVGQFAERTKAAEWYKIEKFGLAWLIVIFLDALLIFWNSVAILAVEDWTFVEFLMMIGGPILLFILVGLLTDLRYDPNSKGSDGYSANNRFFETLFLLQIWYMAIEYKFSDQLEFDTLMAGGVALMAGISRCLPTLGVLRAGLVLSAGLILSGLIFSGVS